MMKMVRKTPIKTKTPHGSGNEIYAAIRRISKTLEMPRDRRDLEISRRLLSEGKPAKAAIFGINEYRADIIVLSEQPARTRDVKFPFAPTGRVNPRNFMLNYAKAVTKLDGVIWYYITPTQTRQISAQHARDLAEDWDDAGKRLVASL